MKRILIWGFFFALAGFAVAAGWILFQPKVTMHHPDFGKDCVDLRDAATENAVDCVRVFYGTNRKVALDDGEAPASNGEVDTKAVDPVDGEELVLGRADIWLPKLIEEGGSRERGETPFLKGEAPEEPSELAKYALITRITAAGQTRFLTDLDDALIDRDSYSLLLFVHGFNTPFEDALVRSAQLSTDLSRRGVFDVGVPVLFSWPSAGKVSLGDYQGDRDRSLASAPYLEQFLDILTDNADVDRINIVAHSMGNRVLTQALEDFASDYVEAHGERGIEFRIILVAADVDREIFDATTGILDNMEANITIYTSDADKALQVSNVVNQKKRLGDTDTNRPYIRENEYYQTIDATGVATELFGLGHNYYSDNPFILGDMLCAMAEANPEVRALERLRYAGTPDGPEYFRVRADVEPGYEECSLYRDAFPISDVSQAPKTSGDERPEPTEAGPPPPPPVQPDEAPSGSSRSVEPPPLENKVITYIVEDRSSFRPAEMSGDIMLAVARGEPSEIRIDAYTDTLLDEADSMAMTERWAFEMRELLYLLDVDPDIITVTEHGENDLAMETGDGVDEMANRRVVVTVVYE